MRLSGAFTTTCGLPKSAAKVFQAVSYISYVWPSPAITSLAFPITIVFQKTKIFIFRLVSMFPVNRNKPDHSRQTNGSAENSANFMVVKLAGRLTFLILGGPK